MKFDKDNNDFCAIDDIRRRSKKNALLTANAPHRPMPTTLTDAAARKRRYPEAAEAAPAFVGSSGEVFTAVSSRAGAEVPKP
jgi:hypothetical protein